MLGPLFQDVTWNMARRLRAKHIFDAVVILHGRRKRKCSWVRPAPQGYVTGARDRTHCTNCETVVVFSTLLKRCTCRTKMTWPQIVHFSWQAHKILILHDASSISKRTFCETVAVFWSAILKSFFVTGAGFRMSRRAFFVAGAILCEATSWKLQFVL